MFQFEDLDSQTRMLMLRELEHDLTERTIFYDSRLARKGHTTYLRLLAAALKSGTPESFSEAILENHLLNPTETREINGKPTEAKVSRIAHRNIGEAEFNRYYMRAICLKAIAEGIETVEVYRARPSANPRPDSPDRKNTKELLEISAPPTSVSKVPSLVQILAAASAFPRIRLNSLNRLF